jgi:hypothetical protein
LIQRVELEFVGKKTVLKIKIYQKSRAMKVEVCQLHKKISLGLRRGFPSCSLSYPLTFGIFGNSYDDSAAI